MNSVKDFALNSRLNGRSDFCVCPKQIKIGGEISVEKIICWAQQSSVHETRSKQIALTFGIHSTFYTDWMTCLYYWFQPHNCYRKKKENTCCNFHRLGFDVDTGLYSIEAERVVLRPLNAAVSQAHLLFASMKTMADKMDYLENER